MISTAKFRSISLIAMMLVLHALIAPIAAAPDYFFSGADDQTMRKWILNSTTSENTPVYFPGMHVYSLTLGNGGQTVYSGAQTASVWIVGSNDATTLTAGTTYSGPTNSMTNVIVINDTLLCVNNGTEV
jgi:hypothetical protein